MQKIKLFCFPFAGGSATAIYSQWKKYLNPRIDLHPIEPAGRGEWYNDPLSTSLEEIIHDVYRKIKNHLTSETTYAFFGHTMGSLIAYELSHLIKEQKQTGPVHIFFSGNEAPNVKKDNKILHHLPDAEFKKEVLDLGGPPKEIFEESELMDLFLPILRADFKIVETYKHMPREKLDTRFTVFSGRDDDMTLADLLEWKKHTNKECKFFEFDGGHFFINEHSKNITQVINHTLVGA